MWTFSQYYLLLLSILVAFTTVQGRIHAIPISQDKLLKTAVFHSPPFSLGPGEVQNKFYYNINFPKGHIALKSFDAEVVDEAGNSIPLHETYLHHWVVGRYYSLVEMETSTRKSFGSRPKTISGRNSGICPNTLGQLFGLGSETRGTLTWVPDPYGIEVGNPKEIPEGYEEQWLLNVHAIDTRGVEDKLGCTECRCNLYNISIDEYGRQLDKSYTGGLLCCYDGTHCRLRNDFSGVARKLYLKYTVKWMDWNENLVPVKIYILDVTYSKKKSTVSGGSDTFSCKIEYGVSACHSSNKMSRKCVDNQRTKMAIPEGGDIVYGVAHQHSGGIGAALFGQDGRLLCSSIPAYGNGNEAGNEAGYIVGMSTCYPQPGSIRIVDGETLTLESNYSSSQMHTGVMSLFYLLVAEHTPKIMVASRIQETLV